MNDESEVESVRAQTLMRLKTFALDIAETTVETRHGVWRYRRTAGTGSLPTLLLPGIQGGGDVFYELALRIGDSLPLIAAAMRGALRERYTTSEQHRIAGGGHLPAIQRPQEFASLVASRLQREDPVSGAL